MDQQKECPRLTDVQAAWNKGYWDGHELKEKNNPYEEPYLWENYEYGYEEGWLDS